MENNFYVYAYLDPRKPGKYTYDGLEISFLYEPFYIGKGKENRIYAHLKESVHKKNTNKHKIRKINKIFKDLKINPIILKLQENICDRQSIALEKIYIKAIGRADKKLGPLTNLTDGGDGLSGQICSKKTKEKLRQFNLGKKLSKETIDKMSKSRSNGKIWNYGKKGMDSHNFGIKRSDKNKQNIRNAKLAEKNPMYNKPVSILTRLKRSNSIKNNLSTSNSIKTYRITNPDGNVFYTNKGLADFCRLHNLCRTSMVQVATNKRAHYKKWKCEKLPK